MYRYLINTITYQVPKQYHTSLAVGSSIVQIVAKRKDAETLVRKSAGNDKIYCTDKIRRHIFLSVGIYGFLNCYVLSDKHNVFEGAAVLGHDAIVM